MFEIKKTETSKVVLKELYVEGNAIVDVDGAVVDLNKIAISTFEEGTPFKFQVDNKVESSHIIEDEDMEE